MEGSGEIAQRGLSDIEGAHENNLEFMGLLLADRGRCRSDNRALDDVAMTDDNLEDMRMRLMASPTRCCTFWLCVFGALHFFWLMSLLLNVLP